MPAPAGFSVPDTKSYLDKPQEYGGRQRGKEIDAVLGEVDQAMERGKRGTASTPMRTQRTSRTKGSKMSRH
jgi:hypothetical protein